VEDLTIAKIVFAETGTLLPDGSAQNALAAARWALATAIRGANGVGFAPPLEPTAIMLAGNAARCAWIDCLAAANRDPMTGVLPSAICVFDDQVLTAANANAALAPAIATGAPKQSIGPFRAQNGDVGYLHLFDAVTGVSSGRYPRDNNRPVVAPATAGQTVAKLAAQVGHGGALGIALVASIAVFCLIGYWAHHEGAALASLNTASPAAHKAAFEQRLDTAMSAIAVPGVKPVDAATLNQLVKQPLEAMLFPAPPEFPPPVTAAQAHSDAETLRAGLAGADSLKAGPDVERKRMVDDILNAAATTIASDPSFQSANLVGPWIAAAVTVAAIIGFAGLLIRGTCLGAMIDSRNRLSLSLTQMAGWSVLIFSLFYVTSLFLIGVSPVNQLVLPYYDQGVWSLLGISIGSAATSGIILAQKDQPASQGGDPNAQAAPPVSRLDKNDDPNGWSLNDLFMGEEVVNANTTDLSRVQHLVITAILMIIFSVMVVTILRSIGWQNWPKWAGEAAPALWNDKTFLGLLAVSHGGYLLFKGLPKQSGTTTTPDAAKQS
jgi:hypothetical protein